MGSTKLIHMETFTLFWLTGESEVVKGSSIANAFMMAGYSSGAMRALDFFGNGDIRDSYTWNAVTKIWVNVESTETQS